MGLMINRSGFEEILPLVICLAQYLMSLETFGIPYVTILVHGWYYCTVDRNVAYKNNKTLTLYGIPWSRAIRVNQPKWLMVDNGWWYVLMLWEPNTTTLPVILRKWAEIFTPQQPCVCSSWPQHCHIQTALSSTIFAHPPSGKCPLSNKT